MSDGGGGRTVFDPELLGDAESALRQQPEKPALEHVQAMTIDAGAFGTVPGGAAAAGRLETWTGRARTEIGRVSSDIADLATRTGMAKQMATDVNGQTQVIAESGAPQAPPR